MQTKILTAILILFASFYGAQAQEITDLEWGSMGVTVTVTSKSTVVECRAEYQGKPIGSGSSSTIADVTRIFIIMPEKYIGSPDVKVLCFNQNSFL